MPHSTLPQVKKCAYMTVLTNEAYIPGVRGLIRSLQNVRSQYGLAVLLPSERRESLTRQLFPEGVTVNGVEITDKPFPELPPFPKLSDTLERRMHYWRETFFKLQALDCVQYERVILLDSDMLIQRNLDHLFEAPEMSAVAADRLLHPEQLYLNSGLMVLRPDSALCQKALSLIPGVIERNAKKGLAAGDQDVFQAICPDWSNHGELHLPEIYNCFWYSIKSLCKLQNIRPSEIAVVHFIGRTKPWHNSLRNLEKFFGATLLYGNLSAALIFLRYRRLCAKW